MIDLLQAESEAVVIELAGALSVERSPQGVDSSILSTLRLSIHNLLSLDVFYGLTMIGAALSGTARRKRRSDCGVVDRSNCEYGTVSREQEILQRVSPVKEEDVGRPFEKQCVYIVITMGLTLLDYKL